MKVKTRQKMSALAISAIMLIAMFAMVPAAFAGAGVNSVRLYGQGDISAAFPYTHPEAPFDPLNDEAPEKDFMTFNPALLEDGIYVNNVDSLQKVFARQWFVPEYKEPTGKVWASQPQVTSEDIVTEYTYMFVDKNYEPIEATARGDGGLWTKFWLPIADNDDNQMGIDGFDINNDSYDDMVTLHTVRDSMFTDTVGGKDIIIASDVFKVSVGDRLTFLDNMVEIVEINTNDGVVKSIVVDVYYIGNEVVTETDITRNQILDFTNGEYLTAGRHTVNNAASGPTFTLPWIMEAVTSGTYGYVRVGRLLHESESFFVDGAEYDIARIFGSAKDSVKYITIRNPIPEDVDVDLEELSVVKESVLPNSYLPLLPPFNMEHTMIDDINIPEDSWANHYITNYRSDNSEIYYMYDTVAERVIRDVPKLNIYFTEKDTETRFHTNLLEILDVEYELKVSEEPVDILFEIDLTSSMSDEIDVAKAQSVAIMNSIRTIYPNANFGLVSFSDYSGIYSYPGYAAAQYGGPSDSPYTLDQPITGDTAVVAAAINGLALGWGADWPEDYTRVLYEAGNDPAIGWRSGAMKIVVIIGDAPTHDLDFYGATLNTGGDPGRNATAGDGDDLDFETTVADLASQGIIVMAIDASNSYSPNVDPDKGLMAEAEIVSVSMEDAAEMSFRYMADETGGEYRKLDDAADLPDVVFDLLSEYVVVSETWDWLHIRTMPDEYKVFVYPELPDIDSGGYGDFLLTSSLRAPNSVYNAEVDRFHSEPQRLMMVYDQTEGLPDIYVDKYTGEDYNVLKLYGEDGQTANFPYDDEEAPFDPLHDEAPEKDFVTFNPAVVKAGIHVNNVDSLQKVFARQWFVPNYKEPTGEVWVEQYPEYSPDVVTEYTYMFVDNNYNPIDATATAVDDDGLWTKFWFPIADNNDSQIGIDGCDINGDSNDDLVELALVGDFNGGGKDILITSENMQVEVGDKLTFLDNMIEVIEVNVDNGVVNSIVVDVHYIGNEVRTEADITRNQVLDFTSGEYLIAGRHLVDESAPSPTFQQPWMLEAITTNTDDKAYIKVGRLLHTGETFFVDGAEYDVAMIFGDVEDSVKFITIRNPIPENNDVLLDSLSVTKEAVVDLELMPMLPPFNRNHMMVDDIGIPMDASHWKTYYADDDTSVADRIFDAPALEIFFTGEYQELRFHTNLLEILDEDRYPETWQWLHIRTMPDIYKEFVYPSMPNVAGGYGDYLVTSSLLAPNSVYNAPKDDVHAENVYYGEALQRFMFAYEPTDGAGIYMDDPIALEEPVDDPEEFDPMVYDANLDGVIDKPEAIVAIKAFFNGELSREDTIAVIQQYFADL